MPLGLSADPGGLPIYKDGVAVGGVGIEGDGIYTVDRDPADSDQPFEELIAASAVRGFESPALIRGDNILVDGIRLPYSNVTSPPSRRRFPLAVCPASCQLRFRFAARKRRRSFPQTSAGLAAKSIRASFRLSPAQCRRRRMH